MKSIVKSLCIGVAVSVLAASAALAEFPEKPIRAIVPTDAGGSVDAIARVIQRYADSSNKLGQKIAVVNMPGAGGTIATRAVKDADPDGYTIGLWHEGLVTSGVMGVVDYDYDNFRILGSTGYSEMGLAVGDSNEIKSYDDLIVKAKAEPDSVLVATNVGLAVHFVPLMLEKRAGISFRYVQTGGGAKRFPSVVAGHTDTAIFGVSEMVKWKDAGLKPVVIFAEERVPELPDVPTAREKGVDLVMNGYRIWIAPKDIPDDAYEKLSGFLRSALADPQVKKDLENAGFRAVFHEPEETKAILDSWRSGAEDVLAKAKELKAN